MTENKFQWLLAISWDALVALIGFIRWVTERVM